MSGFQTGKTYKGAEAIAVTKEFLKQARGMPSLKGHRVPLMQVYFRDLEYRYFQWGNFTLSHGQIFRIYIGPFSTEKDATLKPKGGDVHGPWCLYEDENERQGEGRRSIECISNMLRRDGYNPLY